ncbi:hypothetical protein Ae201684_000544 [Aphanomyces euteiches]|uniref:Uncharacterized protein n=1 Tax=Aphanomyces euteiches TaxID=100861 RepID=A0A6G0XW76_9STRA|nr:hypothetical protein Ae201684_000544 [Aphanomyces euteiches]
MEDDDATMESTEEESRAPSLEEIAAQVLKTILDERSDSRRMQDALDALTKMPFLARSVVTKWKAAMSRPLPGTLALLRATRDELFQEVVAHIEPSLVVLCLRNRELPFTTKVTLLTVVASRPQAQEWFDEAYGLLEVEFVAHPSALMDMQALSRRLEDLKHPMTSTHKLRLGRLLELAPPQSTTLNGSNESSSLPSSLLAPFFRLLASFQDRNSLVWRLFLQKPAHLLQQSHSVPLRDVVSLLWEADSFSTSHVSDDLSNAAAPSPGHNFIVQLAANVSWHSLVRSIHAACTTPFHARYHMAPKALHRTRSTSWALRLVHAILDTVAEDDPLLDVELSSTICLLAEICRSIQQPEAAILSTRQLWDVFLGRSASHWLRSVARLAHNVHGINASESDMSAYTVDVVVSVLLSRGASISSSSSMEGLRLDKPQIDVMELLTAIPVHLWAIIMATCIEKSLDGHWLRVLAAEKPLLLQLVTDVLHHWIMEGTTRGVHIAVCIAADLEGIETSTALSFSEFFVQFDQLEPLVTYWSDPLLVASLAPRRRVYVAHLLDLCSVHADADTATQLSNWAASTNDKILSSDLVTHGNAVVNHFLQRMARPVDELAQTHALWTLCMAQDDMFVDNLHFSLMQAATWQHTLTHDTKHAWNLLWNCLVWWTPQCPLSEFVDPLPRSLVAYLDPSLQENISSLRLEMLIRRYVEGSVMPNLCALTALLLTAMIQQERWRNECMAAWQRYAKWLVVNSAISHLQCILIQAGGVHSGFFLATICRDLSWTSVLNAPRLCSQLFVQALQDPSSVQRFLQSLAAPNCVAAALVSALVSYPNHHEDLKTWRNVLTYLWPRGETPPVPTELPFGHRPFFGLLVVDGETISHYARGQIVSTWAVPSALVVDVPLMFDFPSWVEIMLYREDAAAAAWEDYGIFMISHIYLPLQFQDDRAALLRAFVVQVALHLDKSPLHSFSPSHQWLITYLFSTPTTFHALPWLCAALEDVVSSLQASSSSLELTLHRLLTTLPLVDFTIQSHFIAADGALDVVDLLASLWSSQSVFQSADVAPFMVVLFASVYCIHPEHAVLERFQALFPDGLSANVGSNARRLVARYCQFAFPAACRDFLDAMTTAWKR